jgi:hypothetical protein
LAGGGVPKQGRASGRWHESAPGAPMTWLRRFWPEALLALLLALPWVALFALGFVWLWNEGRVLEWALASAALLLIGMPLRRLVRRRAEARLAPNLSPDPRWDAEEEEAWAKVTALAAATPPLGWDEAARAESLARETIILVARHFHPKEADPVAHVTLPEALLLGELVSRRLRRWVLENGAMASRLPVSRVLWAKRQLDRYGALAATAWKIGEPLWRALRFARNPPVAVAQEVSRALGGQATTLLGERLRRVATPELILLTGRTAIDLYAGHLRRSASELAALIREDAAAAEAEPPPRVLLAGPENAGKSSLLNALAGATRAHVDEAPSRGPLREHLVETPGRPAFILAELPPAELEARFLAEARRADMILWVSSAMEGERGAEQRALAALRGWAAGQKRRRVPPFLLAMTGCDRLGHPLSASAPALLAARAALAEALELPEEDVIPLALPEGMAAWNLNALEERLEAERERARQVREARLAERDHRRPLLRELQALGRGAWKGARRLFGGG